MTFDSQEKKDEYCRRLFDMWQYMLHANDQGSDGRIYVTGEMIDDVRAAHAIAMTLAVKPAPTESILNLCVDCGAEIVHVPNSGDQWRCDPCRKQHG